MATAAIRQLYTTMAQYDFDSILLTRHTSCWLCDPTLPTFSIGNTTNAGSTIVLSKFCCHASSGQLKVAEKCMVNQPTYKTPKKGVLRPSGELDRRASIEDKAHANIRQELVVAMGGRVPDYEPLMPGVTAFFFSASSAIWEMFAAMLSSFMV